jgi:microcystin-dependent protein
MQINVTIKVPERLPRYVVFAGCLVAGLLVSMAVAWATVPNAFKDGDVLSAQALNDNFAVVGDPSGAIVAYAGDPSKVPAGWLLCDGSSVQRSMYPALFSAVGTFWGSADGLSFNIPDLRGRFLRGVSGISKNDPDCAVRVVPAGSTATGCNDVGTLQGDVVGAHNHSFLIPTAGNGIGTNPVLGTSNTTVVIGPFSTSLTGTGIATESRPKNVAVAYLIKI